MTAALLLIILVTVASPSTVQATDWYADNSKSDANTCAQAQTKATAKKTIKAALACVGTSAGAGANDRVIVVAGTYANEGTGGVDNGIGAGDSMPSGTSWSAPFTLMAENSTQNDNVKGPTGDRVVVTTHSASRSPAINLYGSGGRNLFAIIQGFTFVGTNAGVHTQVSLNQSARVRFVNNEISDTDFGMAIATQPCTNCEILNNKIHDGDFAEPTAPGGAFGYAIYNQANNLTFARNELYNLPSWAVHHYSFDGCPSGGQYYDNIIYNFGLVDQRGVGIMLCGSNNIAYNNVIYSGFAGIATFPGGGTNANKFYGNTIYNNVKGADLQAGGTNLELKNNIFANNQTNIVRVSNPDQFATNGNTNNFCTTSGGSVLCQVSASDPLFTNAQNGLFTLQSGSLAINRGADLGVPYNVDIAGIPRPQGGAWDIGAYEFTGQATNPTVFISLPSANGSYSASSSPIAISGTAQSGASLTSVTWVNDRGGSGTASGLANWTIPIVSLQVGVNVITVTVTDSNSLSGQAVLTVQYAPGALVGAWGCDEGSGSSVADSSGNSNTGTFTTFGWSAGKFGNACSFDGSTSILTVADANSLDLTGAGTLEAWVFPTVSDDNWRTLFSKGTGYFLFSSTQGRCGVSAPYGGFFNTAYSTVCYGTLLPINTWTFVSLRFDGSTISLYTGTSAETLTLRAAANTSEPMVANTVPLHIGCSSNSECFQGLLDNVRIYNYGRNPAAGSGACGASPITGLVYSELQCDMITPVNPNAPIVLNLGVGTVSLQLGPGVSLEMGEQ